MSGSRVSLLVPDVGSPSVGATVRLASHLEPHYTVQIVGPDFGHGVCPLYRGAFDFTTVSCPRMYRYPDFWHEVKKLERAVTGDIVIAVKAFMNTVPVALRLRERRGARAVVYLDEWDGAVLADQPRWRKAVRFLRHAHHPLEDVYYQRVERLIPRADTVISSTTFLQKRFGGHVVPMAVDTERFRPQLEADVLALKQRLGLAGRRLIVFGGVVRPHKGVEEILEALIQLQDASICLLVVGPMTEHLEALRRASRFAPWIRVAGAAPGNPDGMAGMNHAHMPLYLDLADLIVLPLADSPLARSQMPIKVFEAMAMAKPIIATAVSDLPEVLEGCGWIVPPGDTDALASAIRRALDDPAARDRGSAAREKCIAAYSCEAVRKQLKDILDPLLR